MSDALFAAVMGECGDLRAVVNQHDLYISIRGVQIMNEKVIEIQFNVRNVILQFDL